MESEDDTKTVKYRPSSAEQEQESDATIRLSSPQKLYLKTQLEHATQASSKPSLREASSEEHRSSLSIAKRRSSRTLLIKVGCGLGLGLILAGLVFGAMSQNNDPTAQRQANQS